jgi:hypothetical protein
MVVVELTPTYNSYNSAWAPDGTLPNNPYYYGPLGYQAVNIVNSVKNPALLGGRWFGKDNSLEVTPGGMSTSPNWGFDPHWNYGSKKKYPKKKYPNKKYPKKNNKKRSKKVSRRFLHRFSNPKKLNGYQLFCKEKGPGCRAEWKALSKLEKEKYRNMSRKPTRPPPKPYKRQPLTYTGPKRPPAPQLPPGLKETFRKRPPAPQLPPGLKETFRKRPPAPQLLKLLHQN